VSDLNKIFKDKSVLLCDGAMGTMLMEKGLKPGECPEKINLDNVELLEEIADSYINAGADIIETNSFGGSSLKLAQYSLDSKMEEINKNAVKAVKKVANDKAIIAASCGPTGCMLQPYGDTDPEIVFNSFQKQIKVLIDSGADAILIETMTDLEEAVLAIKAAKSISSSIPVLCSMTFDDTGKGFFSIMGVSIQMAARRLEDSGADIIGSNCGNGIDNMIKIAAEFKKLSNLPIIVQSNAGLPIIENDKAVYPESPSYMAEQSIKLLQLGVNIIGGCCGTTPEHISSIRKEIDHHLSK
jgi:5-methyltetrahydrofolate--homocysteine methyltransferase